MIEKLDFLVRFWELKARHATLGEPLAGNEQLELLSLMQLVMADTKLPEPGPVARPKSPIPAQMIGEGAVRLVEVRAISAAGVLVASAAPIALDAPLILRMADAISGVEFTLPCRIAWVHHAAPCVVALVVDGIPTRHHFTSPPDANHRPQLASPTFAMGTQARLVG